MFNKTFFKFLFGFAAIIAVGLIGVVVSEVYSGSGGGVKQLIASFFH